METDIEQRERERCGDRHRTERERDVETDILERERLTERKKKEERETFIKERGRDRWQSNRNGVLASK